LNFLKLQIFCLDGANVRKRGVNGLMRLFGLQLDRMGKTKKNQYPPSLEEKPEVDRPPVAKAAPGWSDANVVSRRNNLHPLFHKSKIHFPFISRG
jgi:hypothetical protein